MASRNHFYKPIANESGDLLRYASVRVYEADGQTVYGGVLYRDDVSGETWDNPFIAAPALVEFYIDGAAQLRLGITVDEGQPEWLTEVIDVIYDAGEIVYSAWPVFVKGPMPRRAILGKDSSGTPSWQTMRIDHEHAGRAPGSVFVGPISSRYQQVHGYAETTAVGVWTGGGGANSGMVGSTSLGISSIAYGLDTTALGRGSYASEQTDPPYEGGAVAVGRQAVAQSAGVGIGALAESWSDEGSTVALGRSSLSAGRDGVALGVFAHADGHDVAVGWNTGSQSWGERGSVGLGANAQYGLPSAVTSEMWAVLLGAHDPKANRVFPWANPKGSQSESWMNEYLPTMAFAAKTVQFQRHLTTVLSGLVRAQGDVTLGREDSLLGFYGAAPQARKTVGDDEPASGLSALDNLIYALRDLGLLEYRTEALAAYTATDLEPLHRGGDRLDVWPEHHGRDRAVVPAGMQNPTFGAQRDFDDHPAVAFSNSTKWERQRPKQALISDNLVPRAKHFLTVARHERPSGFGHWEALINLYQNPRPNDRDDVIFVSQSGSRVYTWSRSQTQFEFANSIYAEDNCDQTRNLRASLDGRYHVWRATNSTAWPYARLVVGGGHDLTVDHDFWQGGIAEVIAVDKTWKEPAVRSMTAGLMFKYRIDQDDAKLLTPALKFIERQHDPTGGVRIGFDKPYADDYTGWIRGWVSGLNKPKKHSPFVDIFSWFDSYNYFGPLAGYWANLPDLSGPNLLGIIGVPEHYRIRVTAVTCDTSRSIYVEHLLGLYILGNVGIWSTLPCWISRGEKKAYLIDKRTNKVIARSDQCRRTYYDDVEVRIYTRVGDTLTLREITTLWGDNTFSSEFYHKGTKVARLYEVSTGKMLATTEWYERALPRATVYDEKDPDYTLERADTARIYDTALAVIAMCESGNAATLKRAKLILATLQRIANSDGSLNQTYKASEPVISVGTKDLRANIWAGLAALHYQNVTGDRSYQKFIDRLAFWLFGQQRNGSFVRSTSDTTRLTDVTAAGYFFFRGYAETV